MKPYNSKSRLVVYRDYIESNGKWRLFWEDIGNPGYGFDDESTVTGKPFFKTMSDAVYFGLNKYNERPVKVKY